MLYYKLHENVSNSIQYSASLANHSFDIEHCNSQRNYSFEQKMYKL